MYLLIVLTLILTDQTSKFLALNFLEERRRNKVFGKYLYFILAKNSGAAYGLLKDKKGLLVVITLPIIAILSSILIFLIYKKDNSILIMSLVFIVGGSIGNLIDRLRYGYVIDFIFISLKRWPIFNLADFYILIGAIMMIIHVLFSK